MRRVITWTIVLSLMLGMVLAVAACPRSEAPGAGGTVTSEPQLPPMQPSETEVPENVPAAPNQPVPPAEGGEAAPGGEAQPGEGGEAAPPAPAPPAPPTEGGA